MCLGRPERKCRRFAEENRISRTHYHFVVQPIANSEYVCHVCAVVKQQKVWPRFITWYDPLRRVQKAKIRSVSFVRSGYIYLSRFNTPQFVQFTIRVISLNILLIAHSVWSILTLWRLLVTWCTNKFNIQASYALPTLYLCVLYLSANKRRLVPLSS